MGNDYTTYNAKSSDCGSTTGEVEVRHASHTRVASPSDPATERSMRVWSTLEALDKDRKGQLAADLLYHWERNQRVGAHGTEVDSEYLEVFAIRR
jgi:hypothetical protein